MAAEIIIQVVILNKMKIIQILFYVKGRLPGTRNWNQNCHVKQNEETSSFVLFYSKALNSRQQKWKSKLWRWTKWRNFKFCFILKPWRLQGSENVDPSCHVEQNEVTLNFVLF
jgi:hypothetical protein